MSEFKKVKSGRERRTANVERLSRLRQVAHRLNRKGIHPTRLNYPIKTADSLENSEASEETVKDESNDEEIKEEEVDEEVEDAGEEGFKDISIMSYFEKKRSSFKNQPIHELAGTINFASKLTAEVS